MLASLIRTVVPLLVQLIVAQLAKANIDAGPYEEILSQAVGAVVAALYYAVIRFLETKKKWFGWFLGLAKPPTYDATAKLDPQSPTGEVAATASPLPDGTPVETATPVPDPPAYQDPDAIHGDV